jgi:hypothetical protein
LHAGATNSETPLITAVEVAPTDERDGLQAKALCESDPRQSSLARRSSSPSGRVLWPLVGQMGKEAGQPPADQAGELAVGIDPQRRLTIGQRSAPRR